MLLIGLIEGRKSSLTERDVQTDGKESWRREGKDDTLDGREEKADCRLQKEALRSKGNSLCLKLDREGRTLWNAGRKVGWKPRSYSRCPTIYIFEIR